MSMTEGPKHYHFPHFLPETHHKLTKPQFQPLKVTTIIPVRSSMGVPAPSPPPLPPCTILAKFQQCFTKIQLINLIKVGSECSLIVGQFFLVIEMLRRLHSFENLFESQAHQSKTNWPINDVISEPRYHITFIIFSPTKTVITLVIAVVFVNIN